MNELNYFRRFLIATSILISIIISFIFNILHLQAKDSISKRPIRVAVLRDADSAILSIRADYKVLTANTDETLASGESIYTKLYTTDYGIKVKDREFKISAIKLKTDDGSPVNINGRPYRGTIMIFRNSDKKLLIVNTLDIEDYLAGVLYEEVSHRWPIEVLKAQAIAARTFALYQASVNSSRDYDLTADTYSQVYGGSSSERERARKAVASTEGIVLTYNGKIFPAYYHATCGGATENADNLWNIDMPVLKSVKCEWCRRSPHYRWKARLTLDEIENRLNGAGIKAEGIQTIAVASRNSSGRVKDVKIATKNGDIIVSAKDFRIAVGPKMLRSTKFVIKVDNFFKDVSFEGFGWGHGVGMCQWGAYSMSRKGRKAEEILKFYYPGAEIYEITKLQDTITKQ